MRKIDSIVIHCSDSDVPSHDNIETVRKWHVEERGWSDVGYHYFIRKNGDVHTGRPEHIAGAHVAGHNSRSIGVCLSGRHRFDGVQFESLRQLVKLLQEKYNIPDENIYGHRDLFNGKTCPNFDVKEILGLK